MKTLIRKLSYWECNKKEMISKEILIIYTINNNSSHTYHKCKNIKLMRITWGKIQDQVWVECQVYHRKSILILILCMETYQCLNEYKYCDILFLIINNSHNLCNLWLMINPNLPLNLSRELIKNIWELSYLLLLDLWIIIWINWNVLIKGLWSKVKWNVKLNLYSSFIIDKWYHSLVADYVEKKVLRYIRISTW